LVGDRHEILRLYARARDEAALVGTHFRHRHARGILHARGRRTARQERGARGQTGQEDTRGSVHRCPIKGKESSPETGAEMRRRGPEKYSLNLAAAPPNSRSPAASCGSRPQRPKSALAELIGEELP